MIVGAAALFLVVFALSSPALGAAPVAMIDLDGAITPVTARLLTAAIERAQAERAQALIVRLNTPGGLERSMRSMAQAILNAEIPVIVYVAPTGARAASAGVFITMAAHVAAMAPATNIGAAHPVTIGGGDTGKEMGKKIENDAAAFARSLAAERGRNVDWAEKAVRASVSVTEREAVKLKVVDLVADSVPDLLAKIDGRTVKTTRGPVTLATRDALVKPIEVRFRDRFLALITDPNVAYILMMVGMLGIFFELQNPGVVLPGGIGGISPILAFFAFQSLPINGRACPHPVRRGPAHRRDQSREPWRPHRGRGSGHGAGVFHAVRGAGGRLSRLLDGDPSHRGGDGRPGGVGGIGRGAGHDEEPGHRRVGHDWARRGSALRAGAGRPGPGGW
jgi:membrane-bound serine protease (ClpP class)